ncbi:MAG: hypothetical protein EBW12_05550 [Actinobacteria bacterium]|nr:hypothetical protein [Actinomycetota bacterium]
MANRYWVGGSGTWNGTSTTNWSTSSGGSSGASVPTAADDVFFDQASTYTVTLALTGPQACRDLTVSAGTVTFASTGSPTISGSMSLKAGTVWSGSGTITFNATSAKSITTNGVTIGGSITLNGVGGNWQLQDALTMGSTTTFTLTNGTLDLNNKTLTAGRFSSNASSARTIAFGTGNITLIGSGVMWNTPTGTNLTLTGTPVVNVSYSGATNSSIATHSAQTESQAIKWNVTAGTYILEITTPATVGQLDFTGFAGTWDTSINAVVKFWKGLTLSTGMSVTFNSSDTFTFAATSGTHEIRTNGKAFGQPKIVFNGAGGTWKLMDQFSCVSVSQPLTLTNGTLDLNGQTLTISDFVTAAGTKNITFNGGTVSLSGTGATVWNNAAPTNFTTTAGTGNGSIVMTATTGAKTFVGGGSSYAATLVQGAATTTARITVTGSNTFRNLGASVGLATSYLRFTSGTTTTFTGLGFSGTSGNLIVIDASSTTNYTFSQASGTVLCDYLSLSRSTATGGATFYAGSNSTDAGNNIGWSFTSGNINATSATTDGADTSASSASAFIACPAVWDLGEWDCALWDGNIASSNTTDGADTSSASATINADASSNTTDGADVNATTAQVSADASSSTTDGADTSAATAQINADATSATTDGADNSAANAEAVTYATSATTDGADLSVAAADISSDATSATTDGADLSVAIADSGTIVVIDTHDGDHKRRKRFEEEAAQRDRRKQQLIAIYEDLLEAKPEIAEEIADEFIEADTNYLRPQINFDKLLENINAVERLYREHQELDDEDVLLLL